MNNHTVKGVIIDPIKRETYGAEIHIADGRIQKITPNSTITAPYIIPGLVDSHVHIESSMLTPANFARAAAKHGTVAAVCDPHEVANVAGVEGLKFMLNDAKNAPIKLIFGAPSCVPASPFDECAQVFTPEIIDHLFQNGMQFLGEMMNYPGVINSDPQVMGIISAAKKHGKPVDGHVPGLGGSQLKAYAQAGISTDHECFTLPEAIEKIELGMKILMREGSAAKNFGALHPLLTSHPDMVMFCTDDCHPDDLMRGHINLLVQRALALGHNVYDVLMAASVNPAKHYGLDMGLLREGDWADFVVIDSPQQCRPIATFVNGKDVLAEASQCPTTLLPHSYVFPNPDEIARINLSVVAKTSRCKAIGVLTDQLVTEPFLFDVAVGEEIKANTAADILKIVVVSRYNPSRYSVGFIHGIGLKRGAIADSIAHDSHHIVAIGSDDASILQAIMYITQQRGGLCVAVDGQVTGLPLPVFGLMSDVQVDEVGVKYSEINALAIKMGCEIKAPFMTMAFMCLSVIPKLKLIPGGLFDGEKFELTNMFI